MSEYLLGPAAEEEEYLGQSTEDTEHLRTSAKEEESLTPLREDAENLKGWTEEKENLREGDRARNTRKRSPFVFNVDPRILQVISQENKPLWVKKMEGGGTHQRFRFDSDSYGQAKRLLAHFRMKESIPCLEKGVTVAARKMTRGISRVVGARHFCGKIQTHNLLPSQWLS